MPDAALRILGASACFAASGPLMYFGMERWARARRVWRAIRKPHEKGIKESMRMQRERGEHETMQGWS